MNNFNMLLFFSDSFLWVILYGQVGLQTLDHSLLFAESMQCASTDK